MLYSKILKTLVCASALAMLSSFSANAHTILLGTSNDGMPGAIKFWMGTYHNAPAEGSLTIGATTVLFGNVFSTAANAIPDPELIIGDNLFYASGNQTYAGLTRSTSGCCSGSIDTWQTASISGLTAGLHTYTISGMGSVNWADSFSYAANWTGQIFIPDSSIAATASAPGMLGLFGLSMVALGFVRRRTSR